MEIKGRVIAKPASDSGISSKGPWKKAYLVIRYEDGQYPKDVLLCSLRKAEDFEKIQTGQTGTFKFDAKTRQGGNGKYYQDLECWSWQIEQAAPGGYQQGPI